MSQAQEVSFTYHAIQRCDEREISREAVERVIQRGKIINVVGGKIVKVHNKCCVIIAEDNVVVTAYPDDRANVKRIIRKRRKFQKKANRMYKNMN
jgi:hypothetical protein